MNSKPCEHTWKPVGDDGLERCEQCFSSRYRPRGVSYLELLKNSNDLMMSQINEDPWTRKVFNFIRNDLAGIINSFRDERITFEYNDSFLDSDFIEAFLKILRSVNFKDQRYDKRSLKEQLVKLFGDMSENETSIVGERQQPLQTLVLMSDREMFLFVRICSDL